jgi:autotransporter family porin
VGRRKRAGGSITWLTLALVTSLSLAGCSSSSREQPSDQGFSTLPVGAPLPSGDDCASRVVRGHPEEVPDNAKANSVVPDKVSMPIWEDFTEQANKTFVPRIDGRFTGTTGEILQWGACKWGLDVNTLRAAAYQESDWDQSTTGDQSDDAADCAAGVAPPCPTSFGILQLKGLDLPGSYPLSRTSTAFNVDYYGARMRSCYEGWVTYLGGDYAPGDLWDCVGWHKSGRWKDSSSLNYTARVRNYIGQQPWRKFDN